MVSKNNTQWRLQHEAQQRPHYGIRKLSVGVASVLLSTTFYLGMTSVAHADTANPQQVTDQQAATTLNTVQNNANEVKLSTPAASTNVSANTDTKSKAVIDNAASSTSASSQVEQQAAENTQAVQPTQLTQPAQPANTDSGTTSITGAAAAANNTPTPIDMDQASATIDKQTSDNTVGANANTRFRRAALPVMVLAVNTDPAPNSDYINYTGHIAVHYKDQSGKTLAPDTNISANFTRDWTRNADGTYTYGTWKYADGSISQTGTHIDDLAAPTFVNSDATLDHFKFVIPSPKIDGYHNQYAGTNFTLGLLNGSNAMTPNQVSQLDMSSFVEDNKVTVQLVDDASGKVVSTADANNLDVFQNANRPDNIIMPIDNYLKLGYYRPVSIDGVPSGISLSSSDNSLALTDQAFQNANLSVDANGHALSSISLQLSNTAAISDWNNKVITIHIAPFTRHQSVSETFTLNYKFADSNSLKPDDSNYAVDQSRAGQDYHQPVTVKATIDYDQTYSFKTEMSEINNFKASTTSSDNDAASGYFGIESCDLGNGLSKPAIKLGINNWNYIPSDTDSSISQAKYRVGTINITRDTSDNQHTETNSTDSYKYGAMAGFSTALVGVNGHESDYTLTSNGSSLDDSTTFSAPGVVTNWNNSADTITHYLYKQPYKIAIQPVDQSGNAIGSNVDLGTFYYDTMPTSVDISQANPDTSKYQLVDPNATQMGFAVTNALTQTIHNDNGAGWTSSTDGQGNRTHIIRVMFTAKNQKNAHVIVNFVDADNNNQQISSTTFDGVAKSTENVDLKIPSGYVDNSHLVPSSITYPDANSTQTVTIPLNHHHTVVTDPAQTEMTRTITEHYVYEDGPLAGQTAAPDAQVEVAYKRSVTTDDTTGEKTTGPYVFDANRNDDGFTNGYKIISGKWDNLPAGWDVVQANVPTIDGYTADLNRDVTVLNQSDSKIHSSSGTGAAIWVYPQWNMSGTNGTTNSDGESYAYTDANSVNGLYEALPVHTVYYKENTHQVSDSKTVTRTINVTNPDGNVKTTTQTATLTRTGIAGSASGTKWGDWSTATWHQFNVPAINGYIASQTSVPAANVTSDQDNTIVNVDYHARSITFYYWDITNNKLMTNVVPVRYGGKDFAELDKNQPELLKLNQALDGYSAILKSMNTGELDQLTLQALQQLHDKNMWDWSGSGEHPAILSYMHSAGVSPDSIAKVYPDTSAVTPLLSYTTPNIDMYIPIYQVPSLTVNYVDNTTNKSVASQSFKNGYPYDNLDLSGKLNTPDSYELAAGESLPQNYTWTTDPNQTLTIKVDHQTRPTSEQKTVTRTINVTNPDGSVKTTHQDVTLTHTGTRDLVTGDITWSDWSTGTWDQFNTPVIDGYTPTIAQVPMATVDGNTQNSSINIRYTANDQSTNVVYKDGDKTVKTTPLTGKTGETVDVNLDVPAGYKVVNTPDKSYMFKANGNQDVVVQLGHQTQEITTGEDTEKAVTRDIYTQLEGQEPVKADTQTVRFYRIGTKDLVTGQITWNPWWGAGNMTAYTAPKIDNYTVTNPDAADAVMINSSTQNMSVTFKYRANHEPITTGEGTEMTVSRDIYTKLEGQEAKKVDTQVTTLHRTGDKNLATGKITWGAWGTDSMKAYTAPEIDNYTVENPDIAPAVSINSSTHNMSVTFNYKANHEPVTTGEGTEITVTRDIYTKLEGQEARKVDTETITLHRTGDENLATGEIKWNPWQSQTMPAYTAPSINNYTVTNPDVGDATSADGSQDKLADVVFSYKANHEPVTTGEGTEKTVTRDIYTQLEGQDTKKVDTQTITLHRTGDKNLATGQITWSPWTADNMPVYAAPKIDNYTVTNPDAAPAVAIDGSQDNLDKVVFSYTANHEPVTTGEGTEKTVTRDIYTIKEGQAPQKVDTQTVTLHRTGDKNLATGQITWNPWTADSMKTYTAPEIKGYTVTNPGAAPTAAVDGTTDNLGRVVFNYIANDQHVNVIYRDDTTGQNVNSVVVNGKTDTTADFNAQDNVPANYEIKPGADVPTSFAFGTTQLNDQIIPLVHKTQQVDDSKTVTRTINVTNPDGSVKTTKQTVTLTRTGTKDLVTNETKWDDWSTGSFDEFDTPEIKGYTPTQTKVDGTKVTSNTQDSTVNISYTANDQNINIVYKDGDKTIKTTPVAGKTDETVNIDLDVPGGYDVTNTPDKTYTFKPEGNSDVIVELGHKTQEVSDSKTITRTINVTNPDGSVKTTKQSTELTRTGIKDIVTGDIQWNDWSTGSFERFDTPEINGYTPTQAKVNDTKVTSDTQDSTINISYTANDQSINVVYKDGDKVVKTTPLTGKTDETVNVPISVPDGYNMTNTPDKTYTFKPDSNSDIVVELSHQTQPVNDAKTVTRTINVTNPDSSVKTTKQTTTLTRTGTKDVVTGNINWNDWFTGSFDEVNVPSVKGYTPTQAQVKSETVTSDTQDSVINISYTANDQSTNIVYKDGDKVVKTTPVTGKTDETVDINIDVPDGYDVTNTPAKTYTFKPDGNKDIVVELGHKTREVNDSKTITRTINVTNPDGSVKTTKQSVELTRTGTKDVVTGDIQWNNWSTGSFEQFDTPEIKGYTPTQTKVDGVKVTNDTQDSAVNISYTANDQSINIIYKDGDKVVETTPLTGKTNETVDVNVTVPDGYETTNTPAETYTFKPDGNQNITVELKHKTTSVTDAKTVTRTINVTNPDGDVKTTKQTVTLTRRGTKDLVTNDIQWGNWSTGSFDEFDAPSVKGYTPTQAKVDGTKVTSNTQDSVINISYTANDQSTNIIYKDGNKVVKTTPVTGKTGETTKIDLDVPDGYRVTNTPDETYTFAPDGNNDIIVELGHNTSNVNDHKKVTRTINVTNPDGSVKSTTQIVELTRTGVKDAVTGDIQWNDWTTGSFNKFNTPEITGYTPTQSHADGAKVTNDTQDSTINITYTANDQSINIVYKDGDKTIKSTPVTGKTDETVDINIDVPDGYEVTNMPGKTYTFKPDGNQDITVELKHKTTSVSDSKTVTRTINVTNPDGRVKTTKQATTLTRQGTKDLVTNDIQWGNWSTGSFDEFNVPELTGYTPSQSQVQSEPVTSDTQDSVVNISYTANDQLIHVVYKDGDKTIKSDPVSGKTGETVKVNINVPDGYEATTTSVTDYTFKPDGNKDLVVELKHKTSSVSDSRTVTRTINVTSPDGSVKTTKQTATLTRTGVKDAVTGQVTWDDWSTGSWNEFDVPTVAGYTPTQTKVVGEQVTSDTQDSVVNVSYTANDQSVHVIYKDGDKTIKSDTINGKTGETVKVNVNVPDGYEPTVTPITDYTFKPDGNQDVVVELNHKTSQVTDSQTVTRTINVTSPDGRVKTTKQTAELTRTGTKDAVTGDITWGDWSTGSWKQFNVPTVVGYTPSQSAVPTESVSVDMKDQTIDISYTANEQHTNIKYVDGDQVVKTDTLTGKTGETVTVNPDVPTGYQIDEPTTGDYTFSGDTNPDITIKLKHQTLDVADHKTVTRTINVTDPDGRTKTTVQKVDLTRTGTKDLVTGETAWNDWSAGDWNEFDTPEIEGYTPTQAKVDHKQVTSDTQDSVINISYTADEQSINIVYKDGNQVIKTEPVTGKTGETVTVVINVPDGYDTTSKTNQTYTFKPDGNPDIVINLTHQTETVTDAKTVTRTINVTNPDGSVKTTTQKADLTRNGIKDMVTGDIAWDNWSTGNWDEFDVPTIDGYTPSQAKVDAATVTGDTLDTTVNVTYTANPIPWTPLEPSTKPSTDVPSDVPNDTPSKTPSEAPSDAPTPTTPTATGNDRAAAVPVTNNHVQPTATAASVQPADNQQSQTDARQLPQTGNERQSGLFAGLIAGIGAIALGFGSRKRKHN